MSRGGPYDNHADRPPAGWTNTDKLHWLEPWEDGLEDYHEWLDWRQPVERLQVVSGGSSAGGAPAGAWQPDGSPPCPPDEESPPAAQFLDVEAPVGSLDRRP